MLLCVRLPPPPGHEDLEDLAEEEEEYSDAEGDGDGRGVIPAIIVDDVDAEEGGGGERGQVKSGRRGGNVEIVGEGSVVRM